MMRGAWKGAWTRAGAEDQEVFVLSVSGCLERDWYICGHQFDSAFLIREEARLSLIDKLLSARRHSASSLGSTVSRKADGIRTASSCHGPCTYPELVV